jgi:plastocyanin
MRKLIIREAPFRMAGETFAMNTHEAGYMTHYRFSVFAAIGLLFLTQNIVYATDDYTLTIKDHQFVPAELKVPAGQKIKLVVKNEDGTPEEFESKSLKREKVVAGKSRISLSIGPLSPGVYDFVGEFHEATAKGRIVVE